MLAAMAAVQPSGAAQLEDFGLALPATRRGLLGMAFPAGLLPRRSMEGVMAD